jgi:hypothetical protein
MPGDQAGGRENTECDDKGEHHPDAVGEPRRCGVLFQNLSGPGDVILVVPDQPHQDA